MADHQKPASSVVEPVSDSLRRRRLSLADEISQGLRERILAGELAPGDRIGEMEVAKDFETSQGPVREAFARLRQEGMLLSFPRRGTFVTGMTEMEARTAYEIRSLLEPYVIEKAMPLLTDADVAGFREDIERMRVAARAKDIKELTIHDMRFHGRFYVLSGSDIAAAVWRLIEGTVRKFVATASERLYSDEDLVSVADMHAALLELVIAQDVPGLQAEVQRQITWLWDGMKREPDEDVT